jgi:hypothetical protein
MLKQRTENQHVLARTSKNLPAIGSRLKKAGGIWRRESDDRVGEVSSATLRGGFLSSPRFVETRVNAECKSEISVYLGSLMMQPQNE